MLFYLRPPLYAPASRSDGDTFQDVLSKYIPRRAQQKTKITPTALTTLAKQPLLPPILPPVVLTPPFFPPQKPSATPLPKQFRVLTDNYL